MNCAAAKKPSYVGPKRVSHEQLKKLAVGLGECKYSSCSLDSCDLDSDLAEIVGNGLNSSLAEKGNATLESLNLSSNPIGAAGLHHFNNFFKNCKLQSLFLSEIGLCAVFRVCIHPALLLTNSGLDAHGGLNLGKALKRNK
jgi:hypothetical protein